MTKAKSEDRQLQTKDQSSLSTRFTNMVIKEYGTEVGTVQFDDFKKKLAQHLFIKIDMAIQEAEARRNSNKNKVPIVWKNVNMQKLAVDAVHRIELQLDALIPNHIHPIPYYNNRHGRYDIDLRIGYAGKDYYHREMALYRPKDVRYELVHENDSLTVIKKGLGQDVESYEFKVDNPFGRGKVVGGFGYISYDDESKNKLVIVTMSDFEKAKKASGTDKFWGPHEADMQLKTITHRTCRHIILDPSKINKSFAVVERQEYDTPLLPDADMEADQYANQEVIDIEPSNQDRTAETEKQVEEHTEDDSWMDDGQGDEQQEQKSKPAF